MAVIAIFMSTVGYDFFVSAFSGNFEAPGSSGLGSAGYVYFSSLVASNDLLVTLLALAFMGWFLPACYTQAAMAQRAIMTWSFDGLLPRRLAAVSPTRHTPAPAILATALVSVPLAVWIAYSDNFFQYFAIAAVSAYPSLVLVGITATLIKRRRPDLYVGLQRRVAHRRRRGAAGRRRDLQPRRRGGDRAPVHLPRRGRAEVHDGDRHLPGRDVRGRGDLVARRAGDAPRPGRRPRARLQGDPARMRLRKRRSQGDTKRMCFVTDVHGSERCFRKFLNTAKFYDAQYLVLGGDITGKTLVPIERARSGWSASFNEHEYRDMPEAEMHDVAQLIRDAGQYPIMGDHDELLELFSPERRDETFETAVVDRIRRWMEIADERLAGTDVQCYVTPGNDDFWEIDEPLKAAERVQFVEGTRVRLDDRHEMVTTGYSNITPWHSPRELPEAGARGADQGDVRAASRIPRT